MQEKKEKIAKNSKKLQKNNNMGLVHIRATEIYMLARMQTCSF